MCVPGAVSDPAPQSTPRQHSPSPHMVPTPPPPNPEEAPMGEKHPETAGKTRSPVSASATQGCSRHLSGASGGIRGLDVLHFPSLGPCGHTAFPGSGRTDWGNRPPYPGLMPRVCRHSPCGRHWGDRRPHSFLFLTTGIGTTWKILALWSSVFRFTQVGRKPPLKPTNAIFSEKQESVA